MPTTLPFKTLKIWKRGMALAKRIYECTALFPKSEQYNLTSQMQKSAVSVPSNIAEGSQRTSDKEFAHFIDIARGSLAELETQVLLASEFNFIKDAEVSELEKEIDELNRMIYKFCETLKTNR